MNARDSLRWIALGGGAILAISIGIAGLADSEAIVAELAGLRQERANGPGRFLGPEPPANPVTERERIDRIIWEMAQEEKRDPVAFYAKNQASIVSLERRRKAHWGGVAASIAVVLCGALVTNTLIARVRLPAVSRRALQALTRPGLAVGMVMLATFLAVLTWRDLEGEWAPYTGACSAGLIAAAWLVRSPRRATSP